MRGFVYHVAPFAPGWCKLSWRALAAGAALWAALSPAISAEPFGSQLFTGRFSAERVESVNPDYRIVPGDRIVLRLWGAATIDETLVVDAQGNIFIRDIGPLMVAGVRNADLTPMVKRRVGEVYRSNVDVYTNVLGTQPLSVFVTGFVASPGAYSGVASDSILYFLDRAGGIDHVRGSFRDIKVLRQHRMIGQVDLYDFLLEGRLPSLQFQNGDTILVGAIGHTVTVEGSVVNPGAFEFAQQPVSGAEALKYARPLPSASHAQLTGTRGETPLAAYLPLGDIAHEELFEGDALLVQRDLRVDTILVAVEGANLGPSRISVPRDATLSEVLDRIPVDADRANILAIHIKRASVAARQKAGIEQSLRQLEASVSTARSATVEESRIRLQEAELIMKFIDRARQAQPRGILVVADRGGVRDVRMEEGDVIVVPAFSDVILVSGEVLYPSAMVHDADMTVAEYVARAGGYTRDADRERALLVKQTGEVIPTEGAVVGPGDEIIVLPRVETKTLQLAKDVTQALYQVVVAVALPFKL